MHALYPQLKHALSLQLSQQISYALSATVDDNFRCIIPHHSGHAMAQWNRETIFMSQMIAHQLCPPHFVSISGGIIIFLTKFRYLFCHNGFIRTDSWTNPGNMWALMIANNAPCKRIWTYLYAIKIIYGLIISMIQGFNRIFNIAYNEIWLYLLFFRMIPPEVTFDLGGGEFLRVYIFDIIGNRDPGICVTASKKRNGNDCGGRFPSLTIVSSQLLS